MKRQGSSLLGAVHRAPTLLTHSTGKSPLEVDPVPMIFVKDLHMRLKKKKMGLTADLREEGRGGP